MHVHKVALPVWHVGADTVVSACVKGSHCPKIRRYGFAEVLRDSAAYSFLGRTFMINEGVCLVGERRLAYRTVGSSSRPILFLHGVARRSQSFLPLFSSLAIDYRLTALDFRGHGSSSWCPSSNHRNEASSLDSAEAPKYTVVDYVADIDDVINEQISGSVVLYGHSLGAMVAARFASLHPSRVSALVLEDPPWHTMGARIAETPLLSFFKGLHAIRCQTSDIQQGRKLLAEMHVTDPSTGGVTRLGDVRDQASLRFTAACLQHMDPAVFEPIVAGRWLDGYPLTETIAQIQCPTLLLQADSCVGGMLTDEDAQLFQDLCSDCTFVRSPGCGHLMHWLRPTELLSHLHAFLASLN